jgi:hypothetical protein
MILGLQIVAIIFSFVMIYFAVLNYKRGEIDRIEIYSWLTIWIATLLIVIFPEFLRRLAQRFFITRLFDLMVVAGFVLVITLVARAYISTKKVERKLEEIIRKEALRGIEKDDKKSKRKK